MAKRDFNHIDEVISTIRAGENNLADLTTSFMKRSARQHAPVYYGYLKMSIHTERVGKSHYQVIARSKEAGAPREYAFYQEYGTRQNRAHPFMRPAYYQGLSYLYFGPAQLFGDKVETTARTGRVIR